MTESLLIEAPKRLPLQFGPEDNISLSNECVGVIPNCVIRMWGETTETNTDAHLEKAATALVKGVHAGCRESRSRQRQREEIALETL